MCNLLKPPQKLRFKVVKLREHQAIADNDQVAALITDAYATVAIAYRRASAAYTVDEEMQQARDCGRALAHNSNFIYGCSSRRSCSKMTDHSVQAHRALRIVYQPTQRPANHPA